MLMLALLAAAQRFVLWMDAIVTLSVTFSRIVVTISKKHAQVSQYSYKL